MLLALERKKRFGAIEDAPLFNLFTIGMLFKSTR
jgi:hypothetical protein